MVDNEVLQPKIVFYGRLKPGVLGFEVTKPIDLLITSFKSMNGNSEGPGWNKHSFKIESHEKKFPTMFSGLGFIKTNMTTLVRWVPL